MKKTLLIALLTIMSTVAFAAGDTIPTDNNKGEYYQPAQRTTTTSSSIGICKNMSGTLITLKGIAPYKSQPEQKEGKEFWPRFSVQVGAGYIYQFFTFEGIIEYMQANVQPLDQPKEYYNYILGSARVGVMLPIELTSKVLLIPNVKGQFGGAFYFGSGFTSRFQAGVIGGLDLGFRISGSNMLTLGFAYDYRWFIQKSDNINLGMIGGQIGIVF